MSTLRIKPHPEKNKREYRTVKDVLSEDGKTITRPRGTVMYRGLVTGTPEELARFKAGYGEFYREESDGPYIGQPLMNTQSPLTESREILFRLDGSPFIEADKAVTAINQAMTTAKGMPDIIQNHIAKNLADMFTAGVNLGRRVESDSSSREITTDENQPPAQRNLNDVINENESGDKTDDEINANANIKTAEEEIDQN